jgi:Protein of unknown function (DUF3987)
VSDSETTNTEDGRRFAELLDLLGIRDDERVSICTMKPGKPFVATVPTNRSDAVALAYNRTNHDRHVWFGPNPVAPPEGYRGRGTDVHVTRCTALFADIDLKPGGVADTAAADAVTAAISTALGQAPTASVATGHGWHMYWALDIDDDAWRLDTDEKRSAASAAYRRFHRLCAWIAEQHGAGIDNVSQLSRILRVPNTRNVKDPDRKKWVLTELQTYPYGGAGPLSFAEVVAVLDAHNVPEYGEDRDVVGEVVSDPDEWQFGATTSAYVAAMVTGWTTDLPTCGRHAWFYSQSVRLACAHRLGRITEADHAHAVAALTERLLWLLAHHGAPRKPDPHNEIEAALRDGVKRAATKADEAAAAEVGGDQSAGATAGGSGQSATAGDDADEPLTAERIAELFDGEPIPLRTYGLPPFPVDALPPVCAEYVAALVAEMQVDPAMVGVMIDGALSAAVGGGVELEVKPGWREVVVTYLAPVVDPSELKSPTLRRVIRPVKEAVTALAEECAPLVGEALARKKLAADKAADARKAVVKAVAAERKKHAGKAGKTPPEDTDDTETDEPAKNSPYDAVAVSPVFELEATALAAAAEADAIDIPRTPNLFFSDITTEALVVRMSENGERAAIVTAEGGVFATIAGRYSRGVVNLDLWLMAYDGDSYEYDRKTGASDRVHLTRPVITMCTAVQPGLIAGVLADQRFDGLGFLSRICVVLLRQTAGKRNPDNEVTVPVKVENAYYTSLLGLTRYCQNRAEVAVLRLSDEAAEVFTEYRRQIDVRQQHGGDLSGVLADWGGKYAGRVARLATRLHMAGRENPETAVETTISAETVHAAWRMGEFYVAHARAAHGVADTDGVKVSDLEDMVTWFVGYHDEHPLEAITLRTVGHNCPKPLRQKSIRDKVLAVLADLHIVLATDDGRAVWLHPYAAKLLHDCR